jgi:glycosyltransferase involved in cell wall biosynthesis
MRSRAVAARGVYFLQGHETWSGPARRVDATWEAFDRMIVSSDWLRSMAAERFGKTDVRLAVYGVDAAAFTPGSGHRGGDGSSTPVVGFMFDDRKVKGGGDVLSALERVRASRRIEVRAFGLGKVPLPPWVRHTGVLSGPALANFYRSLDLFVCGSREEAGPMTVPEAMACGVPVVTTDVGNVRLWSGDGEACRIVRPRDVSGLASAIEQLLADPADARRLGVAGAAAIAPFTWERMAREFDDALVSFGLLGPRP